MPDETPTKEIAPQDIVREPIRNDTTGEEYKMSRADFERTGKASEGFYFIADKQPPTVEVAVDGEPEPVLATVESADEPKAAPKKASK